MWWYFSGGIRYHCRIRQWDPPETFLRSIPQKSFDIGRRMVVSNHQKFWCLRQSTCHHSRYYSTWRHIQEQCQRCQNATIYSRGILEGKLFLHTILKVYFLSKNSILRKKIDRIWFLNPIWSKICNLKYQKIEFFARKLVSWKF